MNEKEYCLLYEPWLRVVDFDCNIHEVSLIQLFEDAHKYKDLCGELPTQDFAVLRLLLAILHTVFSRYDLNGNIAPFKDIDDALDRWEELWKNGKFPIKVIADYLETQKERFWLFHPERPFFQSEHAKVGTKYKASKLYGTLSESNNKARLFTNVSGESKETMTFSEAARWLTYLNAFDDTSAKASSEAKGKYNSGKAEKISMSAGWLGRLGLVCVSGNNLFETLMLNLIIVDNNDELYGEEKPIWEREKIPDGERIKIIMPDNLSELYTLQSRRVFLIKENQEVKGYYLIGGDFFDKENAFIEPMTVWRNDKKKKTNIYVPQRHNSAKQFWRDFSALIPSDENIRKPGVVSWIELLEQEQKLDNKLIYLQIASVQYGDKDFFVTNVFSDSLQIHASLISDMNKQWRKMVLNSVEFCDTIARKVWTLAEEINLSEGGDYVEKDNAGSSIVAANKAKADFYNRIDAPFRKWLCTLDPKLDDAENKQKEWRHECVKIAKDLGNEIISHIDMEAIFGRTKNLKENTKHNYSAASAMNKFLGGLYDAENK